MKKIHEFGLNIFSRMKWVVYALAGVITATVGCATRRGPMAITEPNDLGATNTPTNTATADPSITSTLPPVMCYTPSLVITNTNTPTPTPTPIVTQITPVITDTPFPMPTCYTPTMPAVTPTNTPTKTSTNAPTHTYTNTHSATETTPTSTYYIMCYTPTTTPSPTAHVRAIENKKTIIASLKDRGLLTGEMAKRALALLKHA